MSLDFKKFKKISETKTSAILAHPDGHEIHLSKSALNSKMKQDLEMLPKHMADGGLAGEDYSDLSKEELIKKLKSNQPIASFQPEAEVKEVATPEQKKPQQDYFTNGVFDPNKFALESGEVPAAQKIKALEDPYSLENVGQAQSQLNEKAALQQQQKAYEDALKFNQIASQRGLSPVAVPEAPQMQPQIQRASLEDSQLMPNPSQPAATQNGDPFGTQAYSDQYMKGINEQKSGYTAEANALSQRAKLEQQVYQNQIQQQQQAVNDYKSSFQELDGRRKALEQAYAEQKIDPKGYIHNMSTGQKIMTGIGLILGGFGGQRLGEASVPMKFLTQQVEADVQNQIRELGKKENLLTANMRQYGNLRDATDMTRVMQGDIVKAQLGNAAAQTTDPLVKARAQQMIGQIDEKTAPIVSQLAMRKTMMNQANSGQIDPSTAVRLLVPEHQQNAAYKELGDSQEMIKGRDNALSGFDQLVKINTVGNRITSPVQTPKQVNAIRNIIAVGLARATAGRVNEYEFEAAKDLYPAPGDDSKTLALKRQHLLNLVQEKMNTPVLRSYGINVGSVPSSGRYGSSGEKKIQLGAPVMNKPVQGIAEAPGR